MVQLNSSWLLAALASLMRLIPTCMASVPSRALQGLWHIHHALLRLSHVYQSCLHAPLPMLQSAVVRSVAAPASLMARQQAVQMPWSCTAEGPPAARADTMAGSRSDATAANDSGASV